MRNPVHTLITAFLNVITAWWFEILIVLMSGDLISLKHI